MVKQKRALVPSERSKFKKKKTVDFNFYFENKHSESASNPTTNEHDFSTQSSNEIVETNQIATMECVQNNSAEELLKILGRLAAVVETMSVDLIKTSEIVRQHRTTSSLSIIDTNVPEGPLLAKFQSYTLPMNSKEEIENLESDSSNSLHFLTFFVRCSNLKLIRKYIFYGRMNFSDISSCTDCKECVPKPQMYFGGFYGIVHYKRIDTSVSVE